MYELSKYGTRGYKIIDCSPLWVFRPESPVKVFDWSPIGGTISRQCGVRELRRTVSDVCHTNTSVRHCYVTGKWQIAVSYHRQYSALSDVNNNRSTIHSSRWEVITNDLIYRLSSQAACLLARNLYLPHSLLYAGLFLPNILFDFLHIQIILTCFEFTQKMKWRMMDTLYNTLI